MPEGTIKIGDEVYILDGLTLAYQRQLEKLKEISDDRLGDIVEARLNAQSGWRFIERIAAHVLATHEFRRAIIDGFKEDESFADRLISRTIDVVKRRVLMEIDETLTRREEEFWAIREDRVKALINELLATQERNDGRQLRDVKATLAELLETPIKEAINIVAQKAAFDPEAQEQARLAREVEIRGLVAHYHQELLSRTPPVQPPPSDTGPLPSDGPASSAGGESAPAEHTPV